MLVMPYKCHRPFELYMSGPPESPKQTLLDLVGLSSIVQYIFALSYKNTLLHRVSLITFNFVCCNLAGCPLIDFEPSMLPLKC